ncbi:SprT-like domain-containing protein [Bizionia sediminis]|uniref:SprT-like domain-containing protein n=1 Tax=Bizionia sediminis TaxID=1737064 RepID=A0ABW5KVH1_9FLAO
MNNAIASYIPQAAVKPVQALLADENVTITIKSERKTRHGDYRRLPNGRHEITINANLNPYRFLITLIHEIAHLEAYKNYGIGIKPHGKAWKRTFQKLMLPFLNPTVFPEKLLPLLAKHFKNPKASSDTDVALAFALKQFDPPNNKTYVFEIKDGQVFKLYNGKIFRKEYKRVKRIACTEIKTGKLYLFNPNAEVELLNNEKTVS